MRFFNVLGIFNSKGTSIKNSNGASISNSFDINIDNDNHNDNVMYNGSNMSVFIVEGSGINKTISADFKPFSRANIEAGVDVNFTISDTPSITITGDDNLVDLIELSFDDDSLDIGFRNNTMFNSRQPIRIEVSCPVLDRLYLNGSGSATVSNLNTSRFKLSLTGSGDITLNGMADMSILKISGSGTIKASDLSVKMLEIAISGSGNIKATATVSAKVRVSGSGNVKVYGNPTEQSVKCSGSGKIKFK